MSATKPSSVVLCTRWVSYPGKITIQLSANCIVAADGTSFKLPITPFKIYTALLCRTPGEITWDDIHDYIWGEDINGGPVMLENNIWSQLGKYRDMSEYLNLSWRGSRRGGLYLEWGGLTI